MTEADVEVGGMHCDHCAAKLRAALGQVAGVKSAEVRVGSAHVTFDEAASAMSAVLEAVRQAGFEAKAFRKRAIHAE